MMSRTTTSSLRSVVSSLRLSLFHTPELLMPMVDSSDPHLHLCQLLLLPNQLPPLKLPTPLMLLRLECLTLPTLPTPLSLLRRLSGFFSFTSNLIHSQPRLITPLLQPLLPVLPLLLLLIQ